MAENEFLYKERFGREFYPTMRWGRKGFLWTKWQFLIGGENMLVVNLKNFNRNYLKLKFIGILELLI